MTKRPPVTPADARTLLLRHLPPHVAPLLTDAFATQAAAAMNRLGAEAQARRATLAALRADRAADAMRDARRVADALARWCPGTPEGDAAARVVADLETVAAALARQRAGARRAGAGAASPDAELRRGLALLILGLGATQRAAGTFAAAAGARLGAKPVTAATVINELSRASRNQAGPKTMTEVPSKPA